MDFASCAKLSQEKYPGFVKIAHARFAVCFVIGLYQHGARRLLSLEKLTQLWLVAPKNNSSGACKVIIK